MSNPVKQIVDSAGNVLSIVDYEARNIIAPAYNTNKTYTVGEYCIYNNKMYKCTISVDTPGSFNPNSWLETTNSDELSELNSSLTQLKSRTLLCSGVPSANTSYNLNESVNNFDYIEIIICKANTGGGAFQNRIISKDNLAVGQPEALAVSAYNSSSYRLHMECGFSSDRIFTIATYNCVGWNMSVVYVVGIGRK